MTVDEHRIRMKKELDEQIEREMKERGKSTLILVQGSELSRRKSKLFI
jgi:hypothetical protein